MQLHRNAPAQFTHHEHRLPVGDRTTNQVCTALCSPCPRPLPLVSLSLGGGSRFAQAQDLLDHPPSDHVAPALLVRNLNELRETDARAGVRTCGRVGGQARVCLCKFVNGAGEGEGGHGR